MRITKSRKKAEEALEPGTIDLRDELAEDTLSPEDQARKQAARERREAANAANTQALEHNPEHSPDA